MRAIKRTSPEILEQVIKLRRLTHIALVLRNRFQDEYLRVLMEWRPAYEDFPHTYGSRMYERYEAVRKRLEKQYIDILTA
jgi:hypothetical protein